MRLLVRSSLLLVLFACVGAGFFSDPEKVAMLTQPQFPWEASDIGAVWADDFNRPSLGSNWVALGGANVTIISNELRFAETNVNNARQVHYSPWLTCSDEWTIRWSQRFESLSPTSYGIGVGIKNFQAYGGTNRGYNAIFYGTGIHLGSIELQRAEGTTQNYITNGALTSLSAGDMVDCTLTRSGWKITATATNRSNSQFSTCSLICNTPNGNERPTISRMCFYPISGTVFVDNVSFTINHKKPARYIVIGGSISDGFSASSQSAAYVSVIQSNFTQAVCNDSSSYNVTTNALNVLPEILSHQPATALLVIGGNDVLFNVPTATWQSNYSFLTTQLQAAGVRVKHVLPTPRNTTDLTTLKTWVSTNFPADSVIDVWTPMVTNLTKLKAVYDSGDGVHPNDAGHLLMGLIIRTNLP